MERNAGWSNFETLDYLGLVVSMVSNREQLSLFSFANLNYPVVPPWGHHGTLAQLENPKRLCTNHWHNLTCTFKMPWCLCEGGETRILVRSWQTSGRKWGCKLHHRWRRDKRQSGVHRATALATKWYEGVRRVSQEGKQRSYFSNTGRV